MTTSPPNSFGRRHSEQFEEPQDDEQGGAILHLGEVRGELRLRPYVDTEDLRALGEAIASAVATATYQGVQAGMQAAGVEMADAPDPTPASTPEREPELWPDPEPEPEDEGDPADEESTSPLPLRGNPDPVDLIGPEQLRNLHGTSAKRSFGR